MILPQRQPIDPDVTPDSDQDLALQTAFSRGFNAALDAVEAMNMKPDDHYWDHTSKEYKAMLNGGEQEGPRAS